MALRNSMLVLIGLTTLGFLLSMNGSLAQPVSRCLHLSLSHQTRRFVSRML